jgi:hypothetical protein
LSSVCMNERDQTSLVLICFPNRGLCSPSNSVTRWVYDKTAKNVAQSTQFVVKVIHSVRILLGKKLPKMLGYFCN